MTAPRVQLAIIIPTYRWDALAKNTLTQAAAIGSDEIAVHIGDNSANPDKHAYLKNLAARSKNVSVSCHPTNIGADNNWLHLLKAQTAPYFCMAADDDSFVAGYYKAALALVRDDPQCATATGLHITVVHSATNVSSCFMTQAERLEAEPLDRLRNYRGQNAICYAISPRAVIQGFADYGEANPLQCPFNDYMLSFHLLSMGTYRIDPKGYVYIYDGSNWQLNDSFIASNARWYKGYDISESFAYLTRLHLAVVAVHFFSSTFRAQSLTSAQAQAISAYLFDRHRREFAWDFKLYKAPTEALFENRPEALAALKRLLNSSYKQIAAIFDDFALVVAVFTPSVAARYRAFQSATLQPDAGLIDAPAIASAKGFPPATAILKWMSRR